MKLLPWAWLAATSLAIGCIHSIFLALAMIAKGGSHIDYCPNLPAGHILPCMPSFEGLMMAALIALTTAVAIFVMGAIPVGLTLILGRTSRK